MCHDVADGVLDNWKFEVWYFAYFIFRLLIQQTYKILRVYLLSYAGSLV